jgi:hypothetical protein
VPKPSQPVVEPTQAIDEEEVTGSDFAWFEVAESAHDGGVAVEAEDEEDAEDLDDLDDLRLGTAEEAEEDTGPDPGDRLAQASVQPNPLQFEPYVSWQATPQPDPRGASQAALIKALTEIVAVEGPVVARRAYRLLVRAAGGQRVTKLARAPLNRAAAAAVRRGVLADENPGGGPTQIDRVLRLPGTPKVRIRARGDRPLDEVPTSEVAAVMARLQAANPRLTPAELKRAVLDAYGLVRMTAGVSIYLDACLRLIRFGDAS